MRIPATALCPTRSVIGLLVIAMAGQPVPAQSGRSQTSMKVSAVVANATTVSATTTRLTDSTARTEISAIPSIKVLAPAGTPYQLQIQRKPGSSPVPGTKEHTARHRGNVSTITGIGLGQRPLEYRLDENSAGKPDSDTLRIHLNF